MRSQSIPDAATLRFSGTVTIDIDVLQPTDSITLNAADLQFQSVAIGEGGPQSMAIGGKPSIDTAKQTATFALPSKLTAGKHVLTINYTGVINKHATGLFALITMRRMGASGRSTRNSKPQMRGDSFRVGTNRIFHALRLASDDSRRAERCQQHAGSGA